METEGAGKRGNSWVNRPRGNLPYFVHDFYKIPSANRWLDHPAIDYLVGSDDTAGRHEENIKKHIEAFKGTYPDRAELLSYDVMLRHARMGARRAVLQARDPYIVVARLKNAVIGALQKATSPLLRQKMAEKKGERLAEAAGKRTIASNFLDLYRAIYAPVYGRVVAAALAAQDWTAITEKGRLPPSRLDESPKVRYAARNLVRKYINEALALMLDLEGLRKDAEWSKTRLQKAEDTEADLGGDASPDNRKIASNERIIAGIENRGSQEAVATAERRFNEHVASIKKRIADMRKTGLL